MILSKQDCDWLKERYRMKLTDAGLHWQTEEWMEPDCRFKDRAPYLRAVAL